MLVERKNSVNFLKEEIKNHWEKIKLISGFTQEDLTERKALVYHDVKSKGYLAR